MKRKLLTFDIEITKEVTCEGGVMGPKLVALHTQVPTIISVFSLMNQDVTLATFRVYFRQPSRTDNPLCDYMCLPLVRISMVVAIWVASAMKLMYHNIFTEASSFYPAHIVYNRFFCKSIFFLRFQ